jgi:hypothetical protein
MTISNTTAARGLRHSGRTPKAPLKSLLAMPGGSIGAAVVSSAADIDLSAHTGAVLSDRAATLAEFEDYLRTVNNRDGRPYEEKTISNYAGPGKNLDAWMTGLSAKVAWWCSPQPAPESWRSTCVPAATIHWPTRTGCGSVPARGRFGNTGIRKMLIRRAEQAGYAGVTPHQFRHTFSDAPG